MYEYSHRGYVSVPNSVAGGIHTSPKKTIRHSLGCGGFVQVSHYF